MKKNHYKKNFKREKMQRYSKNKPKFLMEVRIFTLKDLKKMDLIDSRTYRESLKKKINSDYQGGTTNE